LLPHGAACTEPAINNNAAATAALPNHPNAIDTAPISAPKEREPPKAALS
jgi:hypothetical protein